MTATTVDDVVCGDVDNDGDLDLVLSSSAQDQMFRNDGAFTFVDITPANLGLDDGEALAFADYDQDGDVDLAINQNNQNELWQNQTNNNNYLTVRALYDLGGTERDALGATIHLLDCSLAPVSGVREVNGGRGHGSQDPAYVHMGLPTGVGGGPNSRYVVEVRFVGGVDVVQKAVWPQSITGYQLVEIRNTDANDLTACTTAVDLAAFEASGFDGGVLLEWETGSEIKNLGFSLHRATSSAGPFEPITPTLIPGLGSSPEGATYRYVDEDVTNGTTYYYLLEDVETTGRAELHGPVAATPLASVAPPYASNEDTPTLSFGDPEATRLVAGTGGQQGQIVTIELETPGFNAFAQGDGTVRIEVPGFEPTGRHGLPLRRTVVELAAGTRARILSVQSMDEVAFDSLRPQGELETDIVMLESHTLRLRSTRRARAERLSPHSEAARLIDIVTQGDTDKALLALEPFDWDAESARLTLARRLLVRLAIDGGQTRVPRPRARSRSTVVADFATTEAGLYAVRYDDVFRAVRGFAAAELRLSRLNETIPFHLTPDPERFKRGSVLYFVSDGERANPYGKQAVYRLERSRAGATMSVEDPATAPATATATAPGLPSHIWRHVRLEEDRTYLPTHLEASDPWIWDSVFQGVEKSYELPVSALDPGAGASRLNVRLLGGTDFPTSPDHHVRIRVNGVLVAEDAWNAKRARTIRAVLPDGVLLDGDNVVRIENVGDTGAKYSLVFLQRIELEYPSRLVTVAGRLDGAFEQSGRAVVEGLGDDGLALDVTDPTPSWQPVRAGSFAVMAGHRYLAVNRQSVLEPNVRRPAATTLRKASNRADYLLLGPASYLDAAAPLAAHRRGQGHEVELVSLDAIYSAFGFGETTPEAIRDFLRYAHEAWEKAPRYVVLLGDGTYDFENRLGTGFEHHRVPPYLIDTRFMRTASDPSYAAVIGDDDVPDLAVGRLPAASVEALSQTIRKILVYETSPRGSNEVVLVADDPDLAGNFEADAQELAATVLAGRLVDPIYLRQLGTEATRQRIIDAMNRGPSVVSYVGHGGIDLWADEVLFRSSTVPSLAPRPDLPIVLTMNCLNGYFPFPFADSLAESLVTADGRGAIAAISPSGLSLHAPAHAFHTILLEELLSGEHERLGDALFAAQAAFINDGGDPEMVRIYHLFGDPALALRIP